MQTLKAVLLLQGNIAKLECSFKARDCDYMKQNFQIGDIYLNLLNRVVLFRIVGYADGATDPIDFPIAPKFATEKLLKVCMRYPCVMSSVLF